jgi:hypothetical protein
VTFFVLASVATPPPPPPRPLLDARVMWLESLDGSVVIPIAGERHDGPVQLEVGASGLEEAPTSVTVDSVPGLAGGVVTYSQTLLREPLLPLHIMTRDQAAQWAQVQALRDLVTPDPARLTPDGSFRLVCSSPSGVRQIGLAYQSGLEGSGTELPWSVKYVLDCVAPNPFAEDRTEQSREYQLGSVDLGFFAWDEDDDEAPVFEDLTLGWDVILGDDMPLEITSAVPPYVTVEIDGPTGEGTLIEADSGLYLPLPDGVPEGKTLRIVTDPRRKSIRLDGEPAAGLLAFGARLRPLAFGQNKLSVTAPGADENTRLRLSYRSSYRSLW